MSEELKLWSVTTAWNSFRKDIMCADDYDKPLELGFMAGWHNKPPDPRIAELEAEVERLRQSHADLANRINIVGSPYHRAIEALDALVSDVKTQTRQALKGPDHD